MKTSDSIVRISLAFLKAQKQIGSAKKESVNPFFHSKYADLGAVMEACKEALNENEISVLQPVNTVDGVSYVETYLLHSSGECFVSSTKITAKSENDPQAQGSAITYARRYALQSILFIPSEDDDANSASRKPYKEMTKEELRVAYRTAPEADKGRIQSIANSLK